MAAFRNRYKISRSGGSEVNLWPGFVDAMATVLLVIIFLLSFFILAQFFLTQELTGRDSVLNRLKRELVEITDLFALEQGKRSEDQLTIASLNNRLALALGERDELRSALEGEQGSGGLLRGELEESRGRALQAEGQVSVLTQQVTALRLQIQELNGLLLASEERAKDSEETIVQLNSRLNSALVRTAQTLARYQSTFLRRMREILKDRDDIRVVDDRFVFQSEVLFGSGSAQIGAAGKRELAVLADALVDIDREIPQDFQWVLRVDGHTDSTPIRSERFPSNWELSVARSLAVVRQLIEEGVPPEHLVVAGFGEFHPVVVGTSSADNRRNRRIELKLTTP